MPRRRDAFFVLAFLAGDASADSPFAQGRTWEWRAAHGNDVLTEVIPPIDDQGITVDLSFALRRWVDPYAFGGALRLRVLTERTMVRNQRRWDLLELFATADRAWHGRVTTSARLGAALGGNHGGLAIQDTWHRISGTGPTVDEGLQNDYDGDRTAGVVGGGQVRGTLGPPHAGGYASLDLQGALGNTGVSSIEALVGGHIARPGRVELGAHVELGVGWYHVRDPNLALPGGYATGDSPLFFRIGVHVAWHRFRIEYTYRANEGGSGEPIGVIEFIAAR